jgi:hypothetical protein
MSCEQADAELVFEARDAAAQGRLGNPVPSRSAGETAIARHMNKGGQIIEIHSQAISELDIVTLAPIKRAVNFANANCTHCRSS